MENAKFRKRVLAFVIDMLILGLLVGFTLVLFKSNSETVKVINDEITEANMSYLESMISLNDYIRRYASLMHELDKLDFIPNMLNCLYIIVLFIYVPFFFKGQTIGMKFLEVKIVKKDDSQSNLLDYTLRALIFYSLGYLIISLSTLYLLSSLAYFLVSFILIFLSILLVIISAFMILYRHDRKGLHDILTKTKVVNV